MAFLVTARKWRPQRFAEVVAQEHITQTLANAVLADRVAQCYLLCGPRGVGKTTTARILAKVLNCADRAGADPCDVCPSCRSIAAGTSMNVLEIDGASNNSVDDVRELREVVRYVPTEGKYKIYIIDEVHMLSAAAFNALLKTLEEPPPHVVFIFATTEVQEVPETILSRCQRFNFRRIPTDRIAAHLATIAQAEGIVAEEEALYLLAARADGALRDAESLLDQVVSFDPSGVSLDAVRQVLGLVDGGIYFELTAAIAEARAARALELLGAVCDSGADLEEFVHGFIAHVRNLVFARLVGPAAMVDVSPGERQRYADAASVFAVEDLVRALHVLLELQAAVRRSVQPRFRVEMALVRLAAMGRAVDLAELVQRVSALEQRLRGERPPAGGLPAAGAAAGAGASAPHTARQPGEADARAEANRAPAGQQAAPGAAESVPRSRALEEEVGGTRVGQAGGGPSGAGAAPAEAGGGRRPSGQEPSAVADAGPDEPGAPLTLARAQQDWGALLEDVRQAQPALAVFLRDGRPVALEGLALTLAFAEGDRFQLSQVQRARAAIEELAAKRWGVRVHLRCVVAPSQEPAPAPRPADGELDPAVRAVVDAFDGELL